MHTYAVLTAVATFLLIIAGGLVTSTDSGLAVPDWPLSYGTWFPPMVGGILYEHGHRMIAATVGLMMLGLAIWLWRVEPRAWVRRLGYVALGAVVLQGLLGGLTVLLLLPPPVSIAHATLGPTVFCLIVCIAQVTAPSWTAQRARDEDTGWPSLRALGLALAMLATLQLILGAILRHTGGGLAWHLAGAVCLIATWGWLMQRIRQPQGVLHPLRSSAQRLGRLLVLQIVLGGFSWWGRAHVGIVTLHVGMGALVLSQAVVLAWQTCRTTSPKRIVVGVAMASERVAS